MEHQSPTGSKSLPCSIVYNVPLQPPSPLGGGVLPHIDYTGMCCWPGYGFQAFEFRTGYINQENNVGNRVHNYIKLINSLIQVAINFLESYYFKTGLGFGYPN